LLLLGCGRATDTAGSTTVAAVWTIRHERNNMARVFTRRWIGSLVILLLMMPAVALYGCKASADDDGASLDIPPDAEVD
jgi:hypothetical protein